MKCINYLFKSYSLQIGSEADSCKDLTMHLGGRRLRTAEDTKRFNKK